MNTMLSLGCIIYLQSISKIYTVPDRITLLSSVTFFNVAYCLTITLHELSMLLSKLYAVKKLQASPAHYNGALWYPVMKNHAVYFGVALRETLILLSAMCTYDIDYALSQLTYVSVCQGCQVCSAYDHNPL